MKKNSRVGMKWDGEKAMWDLLDFEFMDQSVKVLTMGAIKYAPNNWHKVKPHRYRAAMMRHISAYLQGQECDPESNLSHLAHVFCNIMFLHGHDKMRRKRNESA